MSSPFTVYLITGANRRRGIGFALASLVLSKHKNAFVYATARDHSKASALDDLRTKHPDRIAVVKYIAADVATNAALAKEIEQRHEKVDTVIANAALIGAANLVHELEIGSLEDHFRVNVTGPVALFQALYGLLKKSSNPRFIPISSIGGSIGGPTIEYDMRNAAYRTSKAALNWITRKIHFENKWLVAFPLSPGGVSTDMTGSSPKHQEMVTER